MKRHTYLIITFTIFLLIACNPFSKSWDKIYEDQQLLFKTNQMTFEMAAALLDSASDITDTTLSITNHLFKFPDTLVTKLKNIGISSIEVYNQNCKSKDIRFVPDSLWDFDRFSVMYICYDRCDEKSKKGFHWKMEGSDHKHSFGQGNGWFIYSDSDRDPF
jgi:hypothetical protein